MRPSSVAVRLRRVEKHGELHFDGKTTDYNHNTERERERAHIELSFASQLEQWNDGVMAPLGRRNLEHTVDSEIILKR